MVRRMLVVVAVALLLAGCASGGGEDAYVRVETDADPVLDAPALAAAAERTIDAGTGKVRVRMSMDMADGAPPDTLPGGFSFTVNGEGAFDTTRQLSALTMTFELPALDRLVDQGPFAGLADGLADGLAGWEMSFIQAGRVAYVRMPTMDMLGSSLAGKWIRFEGSEHAGLGQSGLPGTTGGTITDPSAMLGYLRGVGADLTTIGTEVIDGVETTHVRAVVSVRDALDASGADRERMEQALRGLGGGLGEAIEELSFPFDVYVDADGYVRRLTMSYDFSELFDVFEGLSGSERRGATPDPGMSMTMTIDFFDFGEPVSITEPAPGEYVDLCEVLGGMLGGREPAGVPSMC